MGRGKRTLLLKEKRLPRMPTDVVHRLYKEFDLFDIENSIKREIKRWVSVDLGLKLHNLSTASANQASALGFIPLRFAGATRPMLQIYEDDET
jgi:hypothetical protein